MNLFHRFQSHYYEKLPTFTRPKLVTQTHIRLVIAAGVLVGIFSIWSLTRLVSNDDIEQLEIKPVACPPHNKPYVSLDNYEYLNTMPFLRNETFVPSSQQRGVFSSLYSDSYALGVAVLGRSIRRANVNARLILPYIPSQVSSNALCIVETVGWELHPVPVLPPPHDGKDIFGRFKDQYTKLRLWSLGEELGIKSAVYLDADTLVLRNFDELFNIPWNFGAITDTYGDDRGFSISFNAGVLAFRPSRKTFEDMKSRLETANFPLGEAEQAFLNLYFGAKVLRLPYVYNSNLAVKYRSTEVWKEMKDEMRVIHYTLIKPFWDWYIPNEELMTPERTREIVDDRAAHDNGFFKEEVDWWRDAFEGLMDEKGEAIRSCYPSTSSS
ncbi:hypothetical protein VKT23_008116 [Stygiomarasmius scandens]|uniref:Nucleotide-diphospho-sugar transferase n=1 Tax=Marasmiellus scandens TaxID=2682957 RepID=A0ABR1JHB1_9AGAR